MGRKIITKKAIEFILLEKFLAEFEVVDGQLQHREKIDFDEWLEKRGLVYPKKEKHG